MLCFLLPFSICSIPCAPAAAEKCSLTQASQLARSCAFSSGLSGLLGSSYRHRRYHSISSGCGSSARLLGMHQICLGAVSAAVPDSITTHTSLSTQRQTCLTADDQGVHQPVHRQTVRRCICCWLHILALPQERTGTVCDQLAQIMSLPISIGLEPRPQGPACYIQGSRTVGNKTSRWTSQARTSYH